MMRRIRQSMQEWKMKKTLALVLTMLLSAAPSRLLAKGATTKVVIEGPDLSKPIEITDPKVLANFNVWAGPRDAFHPAGIRCART
jgi:hypothetical protein